MHIEPISDLRAAQQLLAAMDLPYADLATLPDLTLVGMHSAGELVAMAGIEGHAQIGLLRSLAVAPAYRQQGLASQLVAHLEQLARQQGRHTLYLLTTSAEALFVRHGYQAIAREAAPPALRQTNQFSTLCPASARILSKPLT